MNTPFNFEQEVENRIVYIRAVDVEDLPAEARDVAAGQEQVYAVHAPNGERLALVRDRNMAFVLARQNDFAPVTVH